MEMTEADLRRRKFFDDHAEGWEDHNYSPEVLARTEAIIGRVDLKEGMTVLDVGCGLGVLQPFLRRRVGKTGRLAMLDFSPKMIAGAARRHPDSWPLLARAEEIPLPDAFVDVVICFSAFPHVSDKPAAAREFLRVLRPGGAAYVLHVDGREKLNAMHGRHSAVSGDHFLSPEEMTAVFREAGFGRIETDEGGDHFYFCARREG